MHNVLSLILGGGRGTRLYPLTQFRSKPAVPIAGKYRLIDIPISNCINSGLQRIYVLTQFLSVSLHRHIANTYKFDPFSRGFVEILAAQQTNETTDWYQGTADAVRQNLRYIHENAGDEVLILSGDQLYRMDYRTMVKTHRDSGADATIAVLPVATEQTPGLGLVRVDEPGRVMGFVEKPQRPELLKPIRMDPAWMERRGVTSAGREYLASMGTYLFKKKVLIDILDDMAKATDFGKEIFPKSLERLHVQAHLFDGYWEDVGTIKAYHEASLELAGANPPFDFHSPGGVIYTRMRYLPASRISGAKLHECLVSDGCRVQKGTQIERSVLGVRTVIGRDCRISRCVLIGADDFETKEDLEINKRDGRPPLGIGDGSVIENAILDKDCRIGRNVRITNEAKVENEERDNYVIREGVVVIPKGAVVPDGTVI